MTTGPAVAFGRASGAGARHRWIGWVERVVAGVVGAVAAVAVVAEVAILLLGVVFRFVLDRPLVWTDELASTVFLWLAMLGAVLALHSGRICG